MNPTNLSNPAGDANHSESAKIESQLTDSKHSPEEMKRLAAKEQITKYYYQLTDGCGNKECTNQCCASCLQFKYPNLNRNEAAAMSLELFKSRSPLCPESGVTPSKMIKTVANETTEQSTENRESSVDKENITDSEVENVAKEQTNNSNNIQFLTEDILTKTIEDCMKTNRWTPLTTIIYNIFSDPKLLMNSFQKSDDDFTAAKSSKISLRTSSSAQSSRKVKNGSSSHHVKDVDDELRKIIGSAVDRIVENSDDDDIVDLGSVTISVDVESLKSCYTKLLSLPDQSTYTEPFQTALLLLSRNIESGFRSDGSNGGTGCSGLSSCSMLPNIYAVIMEMPLLDSLELVENALPSFYRTVRLLPLPCQLALVHYWAGRFRDDATSLRRLVTGVQQMITIRVIMTPWTHQDRLVNDDECICGAVIMLKLLNYASMIGGRMDDAWIKKQKRAEDVFLQTFFNRSRIPKERRKEKLSSRLDPLSIELGIRPLDCRHPLIPAKEFVNETLSETIEMDRDYAHYRVPNETQFSFMSHPFVLTTVAKQLGLYFDNRIRMFDERRATLFQNVLQAGSSNAILPPYLRLHVRRDHLVDDALVNLETITMSNPQDLKKQLFVEFEGEQGVDEGGVSKEFFQLIVEELFNPDFGMFRFDDETQTFWFNELSFENDAQFTLIGIILGLAIYNNVILDIRFPMVLYRKLLGKKGCFDDLLLAQPTLGRNLTSLLEYEGDVTDLSQFFSINTVDVFGNVHSHELVPNGAEIPVTNDNRREFVDLYSNFLLNKLVKKQFQAFKRGFCMVTNESPLEQLFNADELELLVCGSEENSDFHSLEETTEYDGGYSKDSPIIKQFWEIVHGMTHEEKKKLLQFTTGSDRVPVGGLSKLKLIIARHGPDSDRLPTSHTCFNVLMLPEYSSKEKLKERILKAICYSKGFGML
ncbi:hypothetical protein HELRODRAFT_108537 [Helobdella robusta]|uniref:Ubiquitin-protein ligase E3A n=1 Tax=Helobdella robusta TaxID=6412 RepID=T1EEK0_HELRO|nr:hypothetical protein HELRODRAFT_108537 [Helobdella robusta]ESN91803.1 hypothetical protein HELRODRAFT_108537 [Helobdella robusta]